MTLNRRTLLRAGAAAGLATASALPRRARAAPTDTQTLYQAARQEGAITYYATDNVEVSQRVLKVFDARYPGIKTTVLRLATAQMAERYTTEAKAGNFVVDVIQLADPFVFDDAQQRGWLASLESLPDYAAFPVAFKSPYSALIGIAPHTLVMNTTLVAPADAPKDWTGLIDPRWKGQIILSDPRNNLETADWLFTMFDAYGADYVHRLRAQNPQWVDSIVPGIQLLAAGNGALLAPALHQATAAMIAKGAPVSDFAPDLDSGHETLLAVSARAPHPNAARLLADFLLTREGQEAYCKDLAASPMSGIPGALVLSPHYQRGRYKEVVARRAELVAMVGLS